MPRQVHSWWPCLRKCHHVSVNEATYQRLMTWDLVRVTVTTKDWLIDV